MAFPEPKFVAAHGVLRLPQPATRSPADDERFVAAVRGAFPNVVSRQVLPPEAPPQTPHLVMASTSSHLALSAMQADFEVRFYGDYLADIERGLEYVERKMGAVLEGYEALGTRPAVTGIIGTLNFSLHDTEVEPAAFIARAHLRRPPNDAELQDVNVKVALRVDETYFVHLAASNYESRILERPMIPGVPVTIRPYEGRIDDSGIELTIDVNNNLAARLTKEDPEVTLETLASVTQLLRSACTSAGPRFAETGEVTVADLNTAAA